MQPDLETHNYFKQMYDSFAGNPKAQNDIVAQYFEAVNPATLRKQKQQQDFMNMLLGGGTDTASDPYGLSAADMYNLAQADTQSIANQYAPQQTIQTNNLQQNTADVLGTNTTNTQPTEEQGSFGFGNAPGQLFGKGGLFHSVVDPTVNATVNGIINPGASILSSIGGTIGDVLSGKPLVTDTKSRANVSQAAIDAYNRGDKAEGDRLFAQANQMGLNQQEGAFDSSKNAIVNQQPLITGKFGPNEMDLGANYQEYMKNPIVGGLKAGATFAAEAAPGLIGPLGAGLGKVGSTLLTGTARGMASGGLLGFGSSKSGEEVQKTAEGLALGGLGGFGISALGLGAGKVADTIAKKLGIDKVGTKTIGNIDNNIASQIDDMRAQGLTDEVIGMKTGTASGANNARMNYITQNLTGKEQTDALKALANIAAKDGDMKVVGALKSIYKIEPTISVPKAVAKGADEELSRVDKLIDLFTDKGSKSAVDADNIAKMTGNTGERLGKNLQFDRLGIKGSLDDLSFYKDEKQTRAVLDQVFNALGVKKDARGMQIATDTLGEARNKLLNNSGWDGASITDIVGGTIKKLKQILPTSRVSEDDIRAAVGARLDDIANISGGSIDDLNAFFNGTKKIDANTLQKIATTTFEARNKLMKLGASAPASDIQILGSLDQAIREALNKNVAGYQRSNDLYRRLYDTLTDRAATYNAGNQVSQLGKTDIQNMLAKQALGVGGQIIENISGGKIPGKQVLGKVASTVGNIAAPTVAPIANAASNILNSKAATLAAPALGNALTSPSTLSMPSNVAAPGQNNNFANQIGGGISQTNTNQNVQSSGLLGDPERTRQVLAMGVLNGTIDTQTAALVNTLLGEPKKKELSLNEKKIMSQANAGRTSIEQIAEIMSATPDILNQEVVPYAVRSADAKKFQIAMERAAEMFGRVQSGGAINKEEEARFMAQFMPHAGDDEETKRWKVEQMYQQFSDILD